MRIGVVCTPDQRLDLLQDLLPGHHLVRVSAEDAAAGEPLPALDAVFVEVPAPGESHSLAAALRPLGKLLAADDEQCPCVVRHDEHGRVQVQCGRQAAAQLHATTSQGSGRTITLVFQQADPATA